MKFLKLEYIKNMSIKKKIILSIGLIFIAVILAAGGYYLHIRSKVYVSANNKSSFPKEDYSDVEMDEPLYEEQEGITNILLIGTDARTLDESSRSDSIIIATIDDNNKKIKFTSVMRDSYIDIPKHHTQKINAAYALGGPELLMKTIEMNFRIKLDKYIIVNFWGFEDIIDVVGGIEVEVKEHEITEINKYIGEVREVKSPALTTTGFQKLDGQQALAYARIRKTDTEYNRTSRQREVLGLLAKKLQATSLLNYPKLMEKMIDSVKTNIEPAMLLNYAYTVSKFKPLQIEQLQIPVTELSRGGSYNGSWVLLMDIEQNAKVLNDFVFADKITDKSEFDDKAFKNAINQYLEKEVKSNNNNNNPSADKPIVNPNAEAGTETNNGETNDPIDEGTTAPVDEAPTTAPTEVPITPPQGDTATPPGDSTTTPDGDGNETPPTEVSSGQ